MRISLTIMMSLFIASSGWAGFKLPNEYQKLEACEKQNVLWSEVERTQHSSLPKYHKFGVLQLLGMTFQQLTTKKARQSDVAPKKWKKFLHRRGSMAKVKIVPVENSPYTGVLSGSECALLRLSLTYRPTKKRGVAPGLALKVLRTGVASANISALYRLDGQKKNYNFFEYPLSNIVPIGTDVGLKLVHAIFKRVSDYPEELLVNHLGEYNSKGQKESTPKSPRQIFFVPNSDLRMSADKHEVRDDFATIPKGTKIYSIYAVSDKHGGFDYYDYDEAAVEKFEKDSVKIADIVTTSKFVASEFGDTRIFFRHEVRPKK
ncbi:MAG: hypothetical protein KC493_07885 [Bacteriovoracaceae bacterium]|nr:hypothetical protein [Bacteriovoracaceae bacterium]